MKVWVIAIAVMKMISSVMGKWVEAIRRRRVAATRFMWIPGIRPVRVPVRIPSKSGRIELSISFGTQFSY